MLLSFLGWAFLIFMLLQERNCTRNCAQFLRFFCILPQYHPFLQENLIAGSMCDNVPGRGVGAFLAFKLVTRGWSKIAQKLVT